jgi:hypothetical protein
MDGIMSAEVAAVFRTTNGGTNWIPQQSITANNLLSVYFVNGSTGYITGEFGTILKTTNGGLVFVESDHQNLPTNYSLEQNYPNPFNSSTIIKYSITKSSDVKLLIYNIEGKEISTLISENQNPGNYELLFDASYLSSGIYFYSLYIDQNLVNTRKLTLIK